MVLFCNSATNIIISDLLHIGFAENEFLGEGVEALSSTVRSSQRVQMG